MTETSPLFPPEIESLAARVALCAFHGDEKIAEAVLNDCTTSRGKAAAVMGLLGHQLAVTLVDAVGEDGARLTLEHVVADVVGDLAAPYSTNGVADAGGSVSA